MIEKPYFTELPQFAEALMHQIQFPYFLFEKNEMKKFKEYASCGDPRKFQNYTEKFIELTQKLNPIRDKDQVRAICLDNLEFASLTADRGVMLLGLLYPNGHVGPVQQLFLRLYYSDAERMISEINLANDLCAPYPGPSLSGIHRGW